MYGNLAILQVQGIVFGVTSSVLTLIMDTLTNKNHKFANLATAAMVTDISMFTLIASSFGLGLLMVSLIIICTKLRIDPGKFPLQYYRDEYSASVI